MHHAFEDRGINLDGTLMKHKYGEVLLSLALRTAKLKFKLYLSLGCQARHKATSHVPGFLPHSIVGPEFFVSEGDKRLILPN